VTSWYYDKRESVMDLSLTKIIKTRGNDLELGAQVKRKQYDAASLLTDGVERKDDFSDYNTLDIYSLFMLDEYSIDEKNLIALTLKYDYHKHNVVIEDTDNYVARIGYIYNDESWMWKTFLIHTYGYPVFIQNSYFPFVYTQNAQLEDEDRYAVATELHYKTEKSSSSLRLMHTMIDHQIILNQKKAYINRGQRAEMSGVYVSHEYNFNLRNKISLSGYMAKNNQDYDKSSAYGAMMQLYNTFGKFDLYNEVIYKAGYNFDATPTLKVNVGDAYDYTLALAYHPTKDLTLSLKGENLLDKAIETPYAIPARQTVEYISPFDRVIRFGLKYVF
jgi:iron complex outermembrane receptor protein